MSDCKAFFRIFSLLGKGEVFGWGNAEYGQLKTYGDTQQINSPQILPTKGIGKIIDIAAGGSFCMLLNGKLDQCERKDKKKTTYLPFQKTVMFLFGDMVY